MDQNNKPLSGSTITPSEPETNESEKKQIDEQAIEGGMTAAAPQLDKSTGEDNSDEPATSGKQEQKEPLRSRGKVVQPPSATSAQSSESSASLGGVSANAQQSTEKKQPAQDDKPSMGAALRQKASQESKPETPSVDKEGSVETAETSDVSSKLQINTNSEDAPANKPSKGQDTNPQKSPVSRFGKASATSAPNQNETKEDDSADDNPFRSAVSPAPAPQPSSAAGQGAQVPPNSPPPPAPSAPQADNPFPGSAKPQAAATRPSAGGTVQRLDANVNTAEAPRKGPKAYLVEYFLTLVMTGALIGIAISFFSGIINSTGDSSTGSGWAAQFAYTGSLVTLSTAIVFVGMLIVLSRRCRKTEAAMPAIKNNKWRKGFLGLFLILVGLSALTAATTVVYQLVSLVAGAGIVSIDIGDSIRAVAISTFSFLLLASTVLLYSQDYRSSTMNQRLEQLHRWGLIIGVIALAVVFILMPLREQRDAYIDSITSSDIRTLQRAVDDYASEENSLPSNLRALEISDELDGRIDNYDFEAGDDEVSYEICADFRTDTTGESGSGNPLEDAMGSSGIYIPPSPSSNPDRHEAGHQCFEYDAPISTMPDPDDWYDDLYGGFGDDDFDSEIQAEDEFEEFFQ